MKRYDAFFRRIVSLCSVILMMVMFLQCSNNGSSFLPISGKGSPASKVTTFIDHEAGGTIQLNDEVSLTIPAYSLSQDTEITIERIPDNPSGNANGLSPFGQAYRFSPAGTEFDISKPAVLELAYDGTKMVEQELQPVTLQMYYYDERQKQYVNVASSVDVKSGKISAYLEHFTIYLPMARALSVVGNNSPFMALQNPVPNPLRQGAPIYIRATALDHDQLGSVTGVRLRYRKLNPGGVPVPEPWVGPVYMEQETLPNAQDYYGYLIPANFLDIGDLGIGADIEIEAVSVDNYGVESAVASQSLDIQRVYQAGTAYLTPGSLEMTAGYQRYFQARGVDDLGASFLLVPEVISVASDIGTCEDRKANGILFKAISYNTGTLTAGFGAETASANIEVYCGALNSMVFLDDSNTVIDSTYEVKEGHHTKFDIVGYDDYGNFIPVLPALSTTGTIGSVYYADEGTERWLELFSLDGIGFGTIEAVLGAVQKTLDIRVLARDWVHKIDLSYFYLCRKTSTAVNGIIPYVAHSYDTNIADYEGPYTLYVTHMTPSGWVQDGGALNVHTDIAAYNPSLIIVGSVPYVAWQESNNTATQIYVKRFNGTNWMLEGSSLNLTDTSNAGLPSIDSNGSVPYVTWREMSGSVSHIYVKRWNGSAWVQVGGCLNVDPAQNADQPVIAFNGTTPYVVWTETDGAANQVHVKRWNGSTWELVGGALNIDPAMNAIHPQIIMNDSIPYVVWQESDGVADQINVKEWNGTAWTAIGGSLNVDPTMNAATPSIAFNQATPYVSWVESNGSSSRVVVKHWDGSSWMRDDENLNVDYSHYSAEYPSICFFGDSLLLSFYGPAYSYWTFAANLVFVLE